MRTLLRWLGYLVLVLLILLLLAAAWIWFASSREIGRDHTAAPETLARPSATQLADAPRLARVLSCFSCHGEGLRGGVFLDIPNVVKLWAPNLTEVAARATDQQLAAAIRQGIGVDGRGLIGMPSPEYSRLTDSEVAALIAAIRAQSRGGVPTPPVQARIFGRIALATGGFQTAPALVADFRARQPADLGPDHAAGRHIAATTCAECHGADLTGNGPGGGGGAPSLMIAGAYELDQFRTLLRTGRAPHGRDLGLMGELARQDFRHLTDAEIAQLHAYLQARAERVPQ